MSTENWDGTENMPWVYDDGGRSLFFSGNAGDCVCRAVAIAGEMPYDQVYEILSNGNASQRRTRRTYGRRSARNGIAVRSKWFSAAMEHWGFVWTPTMHIGSGCKVHLLAGELPLGRLVVSLSKHYTAVIDGVIHDTSDPSWSTIHNDGPVKRMSHRCVYGYWQLVSQT